jgi:hypothetical protein
MRIASQINLIEIHFNKIPFALIKVYIVMESRLKVSTRIILTWRVLGNCICNPAQAEITCCSLPSQPIRKCIRTDVFAVLSHDPKQCISKAALIIAGITPVMATPALAKAHTALFQQLSTLARCKFIRTTRAA